MGSGDPAITGDRRSCFSSSGEEDGDADWKEAISSVSAVGFRLAASNGRSKPDPNAADSSSSDDDNANHDQMERSKAPKLKLYQIKAQKVLDDLLNRSLEMVESSTLPEVSSQSNEVGIRLFRKAPPGIILDPVDKHQLPRKKPRILPGEDIKEKSKKFRRKIQSVVIDGTDIMAAAIEAGKKSLARFEAKEAAAKAAAKKEEERVSQLKKSRGEKWLPSVAKYMKVNLAFESPELAVERLTLKAKLVNGHVIEATMTREWNQLTTTIWYKLEAERPSCGVDDWKVCFDSFRNEDCWN